MNKNISTCLFLVCSLPLAGFQAQAEERIVFADTFESVSVTNTKGPLAAWSCTGADDKEYNVGASGRLRIRDHVNEEKGVGTTHAGFWDLVKVPFAGVALAAEGDWIQLSLDIGAYVDDSGAAMDDGYGVRVSLANDTATSNAGYGFTLGTGNKKWSHLRAYKSSTGYGDQLSAASFNQPEDGDVYPLLLKITRTANSLQIESSFGEAPFETVTDHAALDQVFNLLTVTVAGKDYACDIDNVKITTNVAAAQ